VTREVDAGPILAQTEVPVLTGDTVQTLAARILAAEHVLYPRVLQRFVEGKVEAIGQTPVLIREP
jgi:phosphoribosylglycinamide formyltransferase-1